MLRGVGRQLTWATNGGRSGVVSVARLHRRLFAKGTPAATGLLHVAGRRPGRAVALRLSRPRYSAARHRVSYRAMPLHKGRRRARDAVPRRFGAASLSILGAPAVLGGTNGGHDCAAGFLNHAPYNLEAVSASKLATDFWSPELRAGTVIDALTGIASWGSGGGSLLGCSNSTVWEFEATPVQPDPPPGTFTITTTYPWTGPFSNTCTSSIPQYTCRVAGDQQTWPGPLGDQAELRRRQASGGIAGRYGAPMPLDLFAGIRVSDYEAARAWYERLLGAEPSFLPHATEAVWELAEHRFLFIVEDAEGAGRATHTIFVDDLDTVVAEIASRGLEAELVTYPGKARKAVYRDADGNEIGFGGAID
jgi:hypothetical protein